MAVQTLWRLDHQVQARYYGQSPVHHVARLAAIEEDATRSTGLQISLQTRHCVVLAGDPARGIHR